MNILYILYIVVYSRACGLDLGDRYVVTGGHDGSTYQTVAQYTVTGDVTYLAELQTGRYAHACSKFLDGDGQLVSIIDLFYFIILYKNKPLHIKISIGRYISI